MRNAILGKEQSVIMSEFLLMSNKDDEGPTQSSAALAKPAN
jgi:hypothetical protein